MPLYTVCAAYFDTDNRATIQVEADSYAEACEKAIAKVDDGEVSTDTGSWDPDPTFVYGVVEGDGDPWDGCDNVPREFAQPTALSPAEAAADDMLAALKKASDWLGALVDARDLEQDDREALAWIDSVIAKAEGRA